MLEWPMRQLFSFGVIGCIGFLVDTLVLYLAIFLGSGLYQGRVLSYLAAVTVTWALNRRFTFARRNGGKALHEWARFSVSQLSGATINLGAYAALVHTSPYCARHPVIAVAVGSVAGMMINYVVAHRYVFRSTGS
jgi:putative flippase GtrA